MSKLGSLTEVALPPEDSTALSSLLAESGAGSAFESVRRRPDGPVGRRTVWNLSSTAQGGGVAEMLRALIPPALAAGVSVRWLVLHAPPSFFEFTKQLHHLLHASSDEPGPELTGERERYERELSSAADELRQYLEPGDILIVHDPQPAGLVPAAKRLGVHAVWRCHVGTDAPGPAARAAWRFLLPYVSQADAVVFSRAAFVWEGLESTRVVIINPSVNPLSAKNETLDGRSTQAILETAGIAAPAGAPQPRFLASDGSWRQVRSRAEVIQHDAVPLEAPTVVQVSRWDPLKDPVGVIDSFVDHVPPELGAHLVLAGPAVTAVSDDPEGLTTLQHVRARWHALDPNMQQRVHVVSLPMADLEENAVMVNALQRRAAVVVQKSLEEGFGLTVAEAMWKSRPVVASRRGGIQEQIEHGISGILLDDPRDLRACGHAVASLLSDRAAAARLGSAAHDRVRTAFLAPHQLLRWLDLVDSVVGRH